MKQKQIKNYVKENPHQLVLLVAVLLIAVWLIGNFIFPDEEIEQCKNSCDKINGEAEIIDGLCTCNTGET